MKAVAGASALEAPTPQRPRRGQGAAVALPCVPCQAPHQDDEGVFCPLLLFPLNLLALLVLLWCFALQGHSPHP